MLSVPPVLQQYDTNDLKMNVDLTQIVQLARLLYEDADIHILDDSFSSGDLHTATSLLNASDRGYLVYFI